MVFEISVFEIQKFTCIKFPFCGNSLMRICFRYVDDLNNLYIKQFYLHIFHCMQMRAKHSAISFLFVCLFDCLEFINPLENCLLIFHSFVDVIITSEGLRILTYARANGH